MISYEIGGGARAVKPAGPRPVKLGAGRRADERAGNQGMPGGGRRCGTGRGRYSSAARQWRQNEYVFAVKVQPRR